MPSISSKPVRLVTGAATTLVLLGAAAAAVLALGSPAAAADHAVMIEQYAYSPSALTVDQGDTVTWTNHDSVQHDVLVTSGPATFQSPLLAQGESWSHTFTVAGSYSYICSVHPDMRASVTARAKATATPKPTKATKAAPAAAASSSVVPTPTTRTTRTTKKSAKAASAAPTATEVAAPAATQEIAATPAVSSASTLDPLLLVAGVSTAVMVFCLLLMTSRPVIQATDAATESDPAPDPDDA